MQKYGLKNFKNKPYLFILKNFIKNTINQLLENTYARFTNCQAKYY